MGLEHYVRTHITEPPCYICSFTAKLHGASGNAVYNGERPQTFEANSPKASNHERKHELKIPYISSEFEVHNGQDKESKHTDPHKHPHHYPPIRDILLETQILNKIQSKKKSKTRSQKQDDVPE